MTIAMHLLPTQYFYRKIASMSPFETHQVLLHTFCREYQIGVVVRRRLPSPGNLFAVSSECASAGLKEFPVSDTAVALALLPILRI